MGEGSNDTIEIEEPRDEIVYNLNIISVLSWRFTTKDIKKWALKSKDRKTKENVDRLGSIASWLVFVFRFLPGILVFFEVVILMAILDQAWKEKYLTEFDGTFSLPQFFWKRPECDASEKMKVWFQDQASSDVQNCAIFGSQLRNFSAKVSFASDSFVEQYSATYASEFYDDLNYVFTHCFPWAYADLCFNILSSRPDMSSDNGGIGNCTVAGVWDQCAYRNCYLPLEASKRFGGQARIGGSDWKTVLAAPWNEITQLVGFSVATDGVGVTNWKQQRDSTNRFTEKYEASLTKNVYEDNSDFICNYMGQILNLRKDYTSTNEDLSIYLFKKFHWVYYLGAGESYLVEIIALVFLSCYVYMTSMYSELMQLLYQIRAHGQFTMGHYSKEVELYGGKEGQRTIYLRVSRRYAFSFDFSLIYLSSVDNYAIRIFPRSSHFPPCHLEPTPLIPGPAACSSLHLLRYPDEPAHHLLRLLGAGAGRAPRFPSASFLQPSGASEASEAAARLALCPVAALR